MVVVIHLASWCGTVWSFVTVKGLWWNRPGDWPEDVPFCDPNNSKLPGPDGTLSKPKKDTLLPMFNHLMVKYNVSPEEIRYLFVNAHIYKFGVSNIEACNLPLLGTDIMSAWCPSQEAKVDAPPSMVPIPESSDEHAYHVTQWSDISRSIIKSLKSPPSPSDDTVSQEEVGESDNLQMLASVVTASQDSNASGSILGRRSSASSPDIRGAKQMKTSNPSPESVARSNDMINEAKGDFVPLSDTLREVLSSGRVGQVRVVPPASASSENHWNKPRPRWAGSQHGGGVRMDERPLGQSQGQQNPINLQQSQESCSQVDNVMAAVDLRKNRTREEIPKMSVEVQDDEDEAVEEWDPVSEVMDRIKRKVKCLDMHKMLVYNHMGQVYMVKGESAPSKYHNEEVASDRWSQENRLYNHNQWINSIFDHIWLFDYCLMTGKCWSNSMIHEIQLANSQWLYLKNCIQKLWCLAKMQSYGIFQIILFRIHVLWFDA